MIVADCEEIRFGAERTCLFIPRTEKNAPDAGIYYRARTHRAGLERDIHIAFMQSPAAERAACFVYCLDFGMTKRVFVRFSRIVASADYNTVAYDDGTDGCFEQSRRFFASSIASSMYFSSICTSLEENLMNHG